MGLIQWLNSSTRKNWHVVVLNIVMGIIMSLLIIPSVVYFTRVVPTVYSFEGKVVDINDEPIEGALVLFTGVASARTDETGSFKARKKFRGETVPKQIDDQVELEISADGYGNHREKFTLSTFKMKDLKYVLEKK